MAITLKPASLNHYNVGINDLHETLNNVIKNKQYNITTNKNKDTMDILDCSTSADSSDFNNNLDGLDSLGLRFCKTLDYKQKNKSYNINVYSVVDYDNFYNNGLFNGWLLTSDCKYSCNSLDVPPCSWINLDSTLTA